MQAAANIDVQFRDAKDDDASSIVAWFATHAEAVLWGGPAVPANFDAAWFVRELADPSTLYRVAYAHGGSIIGVCGVRAFPEEQRMHIQRLGVAPDYRSKGVGRDLIADAISIARTRKARTVSLNVYGSNVRAFNIYEHLGFHASGKREAPEDASGISIYMERAPYSAGDTTSPAPSA